MKNVLVSTKTFLVTHQTQLLAAGLLTTASIAVGKSMQVSSMRAFLETRELLPEYDAYITAILES